MDIQKMVDNAVAAQRSEEMKTSDQLMVGELILKLQAVSDKSKKVRFDFCDEQQQFYAPNGAESYRGRYSELALTYDTSPIYPCEKLLSGFEKVIGMTFQGYKGGSYTMGKNTPVWVANYGDSGVSNYKGKEYEYVAVVGVEESPCGEFVVIKTQEREA